MAGDRCSIYRLCRSLLRPGGSSWYVTRVTTFGTYLRDARERAGLSLRELAKRMGVSHVFLGEVERGMRGLPSERWPLVMQLLPGLELQRLAQLDLLRRPVRLDLSDKTPKVQEAGLAFARRIESGNLTETELDYLIKLLKTAGSPEEEGT